MILKPCFAEILKLFVVTLKLLEQLIMFAFIFIDKNFNYKHGAHHKRYDIEPESEIEGI